PLAREQRTVEGEVFQKTSTNWQVKILSPEPVGGETRRVCFAHPASETTVISERGQGTPATLRKEFEFDDYGNQTLVADYGRTDGDWGDERFKRTIYSAHYAAGLNAWILSLPVRETME